MTTDTLLAISAGATFLLALAAFWAIWQNYSFRKKEHKQRLLNEIIEWAEMVAHWRSEGKNIFKEMVGITETKQLQLLTYAHILEVKENFVGMRGRNHYISKITEKFDKVLQDAVEELIDNLEAYIELLDEWQEAKAYEIAHNLVEEEEYTTKADEHALQLEKSINKVIEEAVKIKTKDIG